jgi:hypothetical protein
MFMCGGKTGGIVFVVQFGAISKQVACLEQSIS